MNLKNKIESSKAEMNTLQLPNLKYATDNRLRECCGAHVRLIPIGKYLHSVCHCLLRLVAPNINTFFVPFKIDNFINALDIILSFFVASTVEYFFSFFSGDHFLASGSMMSFIL